MIMDFYASGKPIEDPVEEKDGDEEAEDVEEDEVVEIIKELIETRIRPTVQYDGGDISFVNFDHESGIVYLKMHGACRGCSQSSVTLHHGIERMLKYYVEEVQGVEEVVDEEDEALESESQDTLKKFEELEAKLEAA